MIQLKNVSKFYYSKGMIASGFSRVNLSFDVGEFVVITGESGSGKTTLLNVISGLDSYEEGELYIEGKETSHYLASDFEEYRKKYIGNIFQNFNLVNSYTVYQNVELILRINGYKKEDIRRKVPAILERVGLSQYAKTKVSRLSGGQKQRVSIARALAKDTAIVVADEPTGNLDSESAEGIAQLLSEISKDKLVIVVTHNYEQFEQYATRKIKMHDGKVVEDEKLRERHESETGDKNQITSGNMSVTSKLRLGLRNTFNIIPKFILLLIVFLFVVFAVTAEYTSFQHSDAEAAKLGYNDYFMNFSDERIILKKEDGSAFTQEDCKALRLIPGVRSVAEEDILLDYSIYIEDEEFSYDAYPCNIQQFTGKVAEGRMPEKRNEILLSGYPDDYYFTPKNVKNLLNRTYNVSVGIDYMTKVKVVGIAYEDPNDNVYRYGGNAYFMDDFLKKMIRETYGASSKVTTTVNDTNLIYESGGMYYRPVVNSNVKKGEALVSEELNGYYEKGKVVGQELSIKAENIYYKKTIKVKAVDVYNKKTFTAKTGLKDFESNDGAVFISREDYNKLFKKSNYQVTVYAEDTKLCRDVEKAAVQMGYVPLSLKDTLVDMSDEMVSIIEVPMAVVLLIAVFFIAYFVIQLILRSRSSYFSILRMLGLARKNIRRIMDIELFAIVNIAYGLFLMLVFLVNRDVVPVEYIKTLVEYMSPSDYVILYAVLMIMSYLISGKFTRKLFKKTAMGSFREEE